MSTDKDQSQQVIKTNDTTVESTDTSVRYAAYASRVRTILQATHRYVAYTSDIGESFRPVAHPRLITSAYAVSWAYLCGDVAYESWKAHLRQHGVSANYKPWDEFAYPSASLQAKAATENPDWKLVGVKRAMFQGIASMGLPAFTIHSTVKYAGRAMKNVKNQKLRTYGPVGLGLAVVPALPYLFDEPVEHAIDYVFKFIDPRV